MDIKSKILVLEILVKVAMAAVSCGNGTAGSSNVKLSGNIGSAPAGRVEICINGSWAAVVDRTTWTMQDSIVTCRSLGYESAVNVQLKYYERSYQILTDNGYAAAFAIGSIECTGRESNIQQCTTNSLMAYSHGESIMDYDQPIVLCQDPIHGDVRLSGSSTDPSRGVVEVYSSYYGWSTVCTDNWSDEEAVVVCRSMGYETGQKETIKYPFLGLPQRRFNNFKCTGHEQSLLDCVYSGPYPGGCRSAFPARISCSSQSTNKLTSGHIVILGIIAALLVATVQVFVLIICCLKTKRMNRTERKHHYDHQTKDSVDLIEKQDLSS